MKAGEGLEGRMGKRAEMGGGQVPDEPLCPRDGRQGRELNLQGVGWPVLDDF